MKKLLLLTMCMGSVAAMEQIPQLEQSNPDTQSLFQVFVDTSYDASVSYYKRQRVREEKKRKALQCYFFKARPNHVKSLYRQVPGQGSRLTLTQKAIRDVVNKTQGPQDNENTSGSLLFPMTDDLKAVLYVDDMITARRILADRISSLNQEAPSGVPVNENKSSDAMPPREIHWTFTRPAN